MKNIKILDCTLRDGGYINNWDFGDKKSKDIVKYILESNIDYVELGFLKNGSFSNKTLFNSPQDTLRILNENSPKNKLALMINALEYDISRLESVDKSPVANIRLAYKKNCKKEAFEYAAAIKDKGYNIFINPTYVDQYEDEGFIETIKCVNKLHPYCFSIVDTLGVLREKDILRLYNLIENNLDPDIVLDFHSHNNLQLSFSNAQCLINVCKNRKLIIDSCVFGMGRGAGNLCTELLVKYINDNYKGEYDIIPILKIIDEQINQIFTISPWGYSVPYYLAAINRCHPNYAGYLTDKQTTPVEIINKILKNIPENKKTSYDENLIKQLYLDNFSSVVDDSRVLEKIKDMIKDRKILVIASGKSIITQKDKIDEFINKQNPFVISLNFNPKNYKSNLVFITNLKRFSSLDDFSVPTVTTSNIKSTKNNILTLNYSSYLNNSPMFDNVALMILKLLIKLGINEVYTAGLDGFNKNQNENYFNEDLINFAKVGEFDERNKIMTEVLKEFSKEIKIQFITSSKYNI